MIGLWENLPASIKSYHSYHCIISSFSSPIHEEFPMMESCLKTLNNDAGGWEPPLIIRCLQVFGPVASVLKLDK